jgi:glycine cleavage system T protein (aminomethyltransferase)
MPLLRTPLHDWHASHGGRLVDFAGWEMPVQYTSITEEHNTVRMGAGMFDVSHMGRLSFSGTDALALIQSVWTNNAATMKDFQVRYGLICNERGGIRDDVLVYRWPHGWAMVVNASNREKILGHLGEQKGNRDVSWEDRTPATGMIAVQGPRAIELCQGLFAAETGESKPALDPGKLGYYHATTGAYRGKGCIVSRTGYTGEDGIEVILPADLAVPLWEELAARGVRACGLGARDTLRLEAAMPLYGHELDEDTDPLQAGLAWAVKLDKEDFIGREALVQRQQDTARRVRVGLELEGKRIAREGATVLHGEREVGRVTSGTFSPTLQKSIAMASVDPDCTAAGTGLSVDIRGNTVHAQVVALPFYKRPKAT